MDERQFGESAGDRQSPPCRQDFDNNQVRCNLTFGEQTGSSR